MALTTIPPEVLSDILVYLKDEHYEVLYRTGSKRLIWLLSRSVKSIDKVKKMHVGFIAIESVNTINKDGFGLFPKLRRVGFLHTTHIMLYYLYPILLYQYI